MKEAQYRRPCGHSLGSPLVFTGGPSRRAVQLGRHQHPSLSGRWDATCRSNKQPVAGASCSMVRATMTATAGVRWLIISRASSHDAQYAASAHHSADLSIQSLPCALAAWPPSQQTSVLRPNPATPSEDPWPCPTCPCPGCVRTLVTNGEATF